jgi:uncharacterized membrane protein
MSEIERVPPPSHSEVTQGDNEQSEVSQVQIEASWSGPLPPPGAFQLYEDALSGSAGRILAMAEKQMTHRISIESIALNGNIKRSNWGLAAAFVLSVIVIVGGIYLVTLGYDWAGGSLVGMNLIGLAGVFIYGTNSRRAQRSEIARILAEHSDLTRE